MNSMMSNGSMMNHLKKATILNAISKWNPDKTRSEFIPDSD